MGLFVAIPYSRPYYGETIRSFLFSKPVEGMIFKDKYGFAIDAARNYLADSFLNDERKPEYLLFVDNDASFHPLAIERLMERNLPMVCGVMFTRELPPRTTCGEYIGRTKSGKELYRWSGFVKTVIRYMRKHKYEAKRNNLLFPKSDDDLVKIDGCGMHFTLIRRDVFEKVRKPYFLMGGKTGAGEDFYFCRKVREAGFDIYADLSVMTGHVIQEGDMDSVFLDIGIRELMKFTNDIPDDKLDDAIIETGEWEVDNQ